MTSDFTIGMGSPTAVFRKAWESIEHDLIITVTSDQFGQGILQFPLGDGPNFKWEGIVGGFKIDAGEDMSVVAQGVREWADRR